MEIGARGPLTLLVAATLCSASSAPLPPGGGELSTEAMRTSVSSVCRRFPPPGAPRRSRRSPRKPWGFSPVLSREEKAEEGSCCLL
ncbi:hypothetical protein PVAP13_9KG330132 [Panicum virgatum]|uniref:Secreted protein n=1 Tax=Panicum virgatum TaxID=38727 RepID=A0A8T0NP17_PANVG|nr:hypothetical protein PVAP13_9KG330132 [Panicum virgatum]